MGDEIRNDDGISRRELLRRGAVFGGAVVWATPMVQTIGMGRAFASEPSPTDCFSYVAIVWTQGDTTYFSKYDDTGWDGGFGQVARQCGLNLEGVTGTSNPGLAAPYVSNGQVCVQIPGGVTDVTIAIKQGQNCVVVSGKPGETNCFACPPNRPS